jgi:hypothetical protein
MRVARATHGEDEGAACNIRRMQQGGGIVDCRIAGNAGSKARLVRSDGEYDANVNVNDIVGGRVACDAIPGGDAGWPTDVKFSDEYRWDAGVPPIVRELYRPKSLQRCAPQRNKGCTSSGSLIRTILPAGSTDCSAQWAVLRRERGC